MRAPSFRLVVPGPRRLRRPTGVTIPFSSRQYVSRTLQRGGLAGYEPESLACVLAATDVAGPGAFWDVGANIGVYSWCVAALTARPTVAFEPTPDLAATARGIAAANALPYRVEECALGAAPGSATLYLSDRSDASNSLARGFRPSSRALEVPVDTMDAYAARTASVPAVVKVDTETTEPDVLRGGLGTLTRAAPWLLVEVLAGRRDGELAELLLPLGYCAHAVTDSPPWPARSDVAGDPSGAYRNWLFAPRPLETAFWARFRHWRRRLGRSRVR